MASPPARGVVSAVMTAAAVLVVRPVSLVAERAAVLAEPPGRSAPATRSAAERTRPGTERPRPERPARPTPAERSEGRLDGGDRIAGRLVVAIGLVGAVGT